MFKNNSFLKCLLILLAIVPLMNGHSFIPFAHADSQQDEMEEIMEGIMDEVLDEEDNKVKEQVTKESIEVLSEDIVDQSVPSSGERVITANIDNLGGTLTATFDFGAGSVPVPAGGSSMVNLLPEFFPPGNFTMIISCAVGAGSCLVNLTFTSGGSCPAIVNVPIPSGGSMNFACQYF